MQRRTKILAGFLFGVLFIGISGIAEEITLTTYYPAPFGAYVELSTSGNTFLSTDSNKNVGIGLATTESAKNKLDVKGSVAIGSGYAGVASAQSNGLLVEGKVLLGTTTPYSNYRLTVSGGIYASLGVDSMVYYCNGTQGVLTATFTTADGKTVTVNGGIITSVN